jgi:transketolase
MDWKERLESYARSYPQEAERLQRDLSGTLPAGWEKALEAIKIDEKPTATRATSGKALNALASAVGALIGGSADLAPSNKTTIEGGGDFSRDNYAGRNLHFGVRENAMGSICNGIAVHGGAIPYAATFLVFYDYMRPAVRLAALMGIRTIFVYTHDSIGVGEDGPTHQPVEHVLGLRSVPNLTVIRPADAAETLEAWRNAIANDTGPTALVLTRQNVPVIDRSQGSPASELNRGGYIVYEPPASPAVILIATGSEVHVAMGAAQLLHGKSIPARVLSMPSWELFDQQPREYRDSILPPTVARRLSIEAGTTIGWARYVGSYGTAIGIDHFGSSAPGSELFERYGFTPEEIAKKAIALVEGDIV